MPKTQAPTPALWRGFPFAAFKALDDQMGTFEGYMSVFGVEDSGGDIVEPGAFTKTLQELRAKQQGRQAKGVPSGRYLLPLFWGHDAKECIGGIVEAREDAHGVYVKGELDLSVETARNAYSGLKAGYIPGMSFGYFALKYAWDRENRRHLKELSVFEATITPIPMNDAALVAEVKGASGKPDWPLGDRAAAWDGGAAHDRIVAWATDAQGTVDFDKLKSVHFWFDGDHADKVTGYKLLYCDVVDGKVQAMPKGVFACAGAHGIATADVGGDTDAVKAKIAGYYQRMAKAFDDQTIRVPWADDGGKGKSMTTRQPSPPRGKASDFATTFQGLMQGDTLQREWAKTFDAFVSVIHGGLIDAVFPLVTSDPNEPSNDPQDALAADVDAFAAAVKDLIKRSVAAGFSPCLDDDGDSFADPDDEDDDTDAGYMARGTDGAERKAGRIMSAANHKAMGTMLAGMKTAMGAMATQHKALSAFHAKMAPTQPGAASTADGAGAGDTTGDGKSIETGMDTGNMDTGNGAGTPGAATTPLSSDDVQTLIRMQVAALQAARAVRSQFGAR